MSLFKNLFGFMVLKCVLNNIVVAAFVGPVSFRKTMLTGMRYEVPAGSDSYRMTTLSGGGDGRDSSLRWNRFRSLIIHKI
jgi:hypothetical protein